MELYTFHTTHRTHWCYWPIRRLSSWHVLYWHFLSHLLSDISLSPTKVSVLLLKETSLINHIRLEIVSASWSWFWWESKCILWLCTRLCLKGRTSPGSPSGSPSGSDVMSSRESKRVLTLWCHRWHEVEYVPTGIVGSLTFVFLQMIPVLGRLHLGTSMAVAQNWPGCLNWNPWISFVHWWWESQFMKANI